MDSSTIRRPRPGQPERAHLHARARDPFRLLSRAGPLPGAFLLVLLGGSFALAGDPDSAVRLEVHPGRIDLRGPHDLQRLVVIGVRADGSRTDATREAAIRPLDAAVARAGAAPDEDRPAVFPAADGETRIRIEWNGAAAEIPAAVRGSALDAPPRFAHDVVASMTRLGCNSGTCHGSQHGKGGLKLSLLGYEPEEDAIAITREAEGRRLVLFDPPRSLILRKPLLEVPHGGGKRLEPDSPHRRALARWIEAGAPGPDPAAPAVEGIEVFPAARALRPGEEQHLLVAARLSGGAVEDVTGRALFSSLDEGIAAVDPRAARVRAAGPGETAIMVRYQGQAAVARITVPYRRIEPYPEFPANNFIDELAARKWSALGLLPSELSSDAEFMRRVTLDAIGTLPAPAEVEAFLGDPSPGKREALIDRVLDRPEYVDYWALKWGDLLRINRVKLGEKGMWSFTNWVRAALRENRPLDRMVRELITAQGSTFTSGPANYFRVSQSPNELAETTTQVFLGIRMQCAQCHHHPFEKWAQDDYYGMAAYFARLGVKGSSEFGVYSDERVVHVREGGEVRHPRTGKTMAPKPLDAPAEDDPTDRRRALARWLTAKDNLLFARSFANRFWGYLMGRGIVEPVDDLRVTNPPSNPELLDALAEEFIRGGFDQKRLIRTILRSRVYQLSSRAIPENRGDGVHFSHYSARRLPAEVLLDALAAATGVPEAFAGLPAGTRAIQLPDPGIPSVFLESFGKPKREITCECERVGLPNMAQALHLMNGDALQSRLASPAGRARQALQGQKTDDEIIRDFYLATFSRPPAAEEAERARAYIRSAPSRQEAVEDLLWSLCNSTEFLFNH